MLWPCIIDPRAYGSFPCEVSVLHIESDFWNPTLTSMTSMPLSMYEGAILYFKYDLVLCVDLTSVCFPIACNELIHMEHLTSMQIAWL